MSVSGSRCGARLPRAIAAGPRRARALPRSRRKTRLVHLFRIQSVQFGPNFGSCKKVREAVPRGSGCPACGTKTRAASREWPRPLRSRAASSPAPAACGRPGARRGRRPTASCACCKIGRPPRTPACASRPWPSTRARAWPRATSAARSSSWTRRGTGSSASRRWTRGRRRWRGSATESRAPSATRGLRGSSPSTRRREPSPRSPPRTPPGLRSRPWTPATASSSRRRATRRDSGPWTATGCGRAPSKAPGPRSRRRRSGPTGTPSSWTATGSSTSSTRLAGRRRRSSRRSTARRRRGASGVASRRSPGARSWPAGRSSASGPPAAPSSGCPRRRRARARSWRSSGPAPTCSHSARTAGSTPWT